MANLIATVVDCPIAVLVVVVEAQIINAIIEDTTRSYEQYE